jgi:hypothetical protein
VLRAVVDWWDGVELWVTSLSFPLQVLLAIVVLLPGCWLASALIDNGVGWVLGLVAPRRSGRSRPGPGR